ncbi:hypothetical protein, partial [Anaerotignum lactatifermentans]|uniref:hypothetical protein n=1 Tax=Anaerotignum lactatifermentans TaxID=160404 RepID=UPI0027BA03E4
ELLLQNPYPVQPGKFLWITACLQILNVPCDFPFFFSLQSRRKPTEPVERCFLSTQNLYFSALAMIKLPD